MPAISVGRTIGKTKRAVLGGLVRYNDQKMGKRKYRRFALLLRVGAVRSYLDAMSVQAPDFYGACGYEVFGAIDGYPGGVTRHWLTKAL
jgi:hypothetical protein